VNRLVLDRKRKDTRRRRRKIEHEERKKERMKDFDASKGRWKLARKHKSTTAKQKKLWASEHIAKFSKWFGLQKFVLLVKAVEVVVGNFLLTG